MAQSVTHQFQAALVHLLAKEGRGAQSRLAGLQKIDRGYLNAIIKGRKPGSEEVRAKIADHFNMAYEDMLALGRSILGGKESKNSEGISEPEQGATPLSDNIKDREVIDLNSVGKFKETQSSISEKILKVVDILESNTNYRDVLSEMIDAFHEAVNTKNDNLKLRNQMKEMEARIAGLEKRLAAKKDRVPKSA
jgi:hypothetical protein